jgi:sugar (pentulose or hexulose) kinase
VGLSLAHTRGHVWRALLEGVCLGTRAAVDALAAAGLAGGGGGGGGGDNGGGGGGAAVAVAGGAARSRLWLQMHADALRRPLEVVETDIAPLPC